MKVQRNQSVLIIGGDSAIGKALGERLRLHGFQVLTTTRRPDAMSKLSVAFDLENPNFSQLTTNVDVVVICAAMTNMQLCETQPELARKVNLENTTDLVDHFRQSKIIFLSTNAVFDGKKAFYHPIDLPAPQSNYARWKLAVERHLMQTAFGRATVLRLTKVIAPNANFLQAWQAAAWEGRPIRAFANRLLSPLPLTKVVETLARFVQGGEPGLFHLGGQQELTYLEYAQQIFAAEPRHLQLIEAVHDNLKEGQFVAHNSLATVLPWEVASN